MTWLKGIGGIAVALLAGVLWLRFFHDPALRAEVQAFAHVDSARAQERADSAAAAARDSTFRAESVKTATQLAAAHRVTLAIAQVANAIAPRVRAAVVDSMKPVFDSLERAKDSTIAATAHERELEHQHWLEASAALAFQRDTVVPKLRKDLSAALTGETNALKQAGRRWHLGGAGGCGATTHGASCPSFTVGLVYIL
jgi:hypothetical protein